MLKANLLILYLLLSGLPLLAKFTIADIPNNVGNSISDTANVKLLNQQCWSLRRTDPQSAIAIGKNALDLARKIGYSKGEAQVLNYLGICYLRLDDSRTASEYFFKALNFSDSLNIGIEKAYALNNISSSLNFEGEYTQALNYARKALALQTKNKDPKGIAYAYVRMSDTYYSLQQYDSLLITAQIAYKLLKDLGMRENSLIALKNIGHGWEGKKQYNKALNCYMEIANSVSISQVTVRNVYADLARVYNLLELPGQAIYYGKEWLSTERGNDLMLRQMANSYALKDDWNEAFRYARMSMAVMDSLAKVEKFRQIKNLQILYETRETEKENADLKEKLYNKSLFVSAFAVIIILIGLLALILLSKRRQQSHLNQLLNQKNEEILIQRDHLDELNQTKNKLFSIIAHDLRGPIGSTSTFLELLTAKESEFTKQELLENLLLIKDSSKPPYLGTCTKRRDCI
jgi:tetratricopeptide (TPR) repeat protein